MAEEHRPYPPSDSKLLGLREQGIFARSETFSAAMVFLGLLAGIFFVSSKVPTLYALYFRQAVGSNLSPTGVSALAESLYLAARLSLFFLLPIFTAIFVAGLWQSKFLVAPWLIGRRRDRTFRRAADRGVRNGFWAAAHFLLWIGIGAAIVWQQLGLATLRYPQALAIYENVMEQSDVADSFAVPAVEQQILAACSKEILEYRNIAFILLAIALLVGVVSRIRAVLFFFSYHRMSRSELEAELRETESSPAVRDAQREFREV